MEAEPSPSSPPASVGRSLTLTDLNADTLAHCASFLRLADVSNLAVTCKPLRRAAYSDYVWRRLYKERWPFQCISSGADRIREKYLDRHNAVNQLNFSDPMRIIWSQYPIPCSHILLKKNEAFAAQGSIITKVRLDPQAHNASGCYDHTALTGHNARITCMRLLPISDTSLLRSTMPNEENILATSSSDRTIRIWWKGRSCRCFKGHNGPVTTLSDTLLGNSGTKVLASGGEDCTIRLWSLGGKKHSLMMTFIGHEKPVTLLSVARYKTSLLVSMSTDSKVRVWDTTSLSTSGSLCVGMVGFPGTPVGMKCHDTLCYVAAGSSVTAIDIRTMQKVSTSAVHPTKIYSFEPLSSEWLICTGGQDKALLWDIRKNQANPEPVAELEHGGPVTMLHMDPYKVVTGGPCDHHVSVWKTGTGALVNRLDCRIPGEYEHSVGLSAMAVDGCRIITSGCTEEPGILYLKDFSNSSMPVSAPGDNSSSKFWESPHGSDGEACDVEFEAL